MSEEFSDKKVLISQFNEAAFQIARLNNLWTACNNHAQAGNLDRWKWALDRIWIELSADANEKDKKKYFDGIKQHNLTISKAENDVQKYNALQQKEIFLRSLQEDVGKGGKKEEGFESW